MIRQEGNLQVAWCPELDIATQGASVDEALANLNEAVALYLEDEEAEVPTGHPLITTFEVRHDTPSDPVGA